MSNLTEFAVMPTESDVVKQVDNLTTNVGAVLSEKTIALTGAVTGSVTTDFSGNITIDTTTGSIDATKLTGIIPEELIPKSAKPNIVEVASEEAKLALTSDDVQNNDAVIVVDETSGSTAIYWVVDDTKLGTEDAFRAFPAGVAASVPWSGITGKPSTFTPSAHTHTELKVTAITVNTDIHSLTDADTYSAASGLTGLTNAPCDPPFSLEVQRASDGSTVTQIVYGQADDDHGIYVSFLNSDGTWSDWQTISYGAKGAYAKKSLENPYRQANTEYAVDAMAFSTILEAGKILKCIVAGTTNSDDDVTSSSTIAGTQITDGTVTWEVQLLAGAERVDGVKVGTISWQLSSTVDDGDLPLLGGTFDKETYAPLWNYVQLHPDMVVTETEWQSLAASQTSVLKYASVNDTTFRVPRLVDFARGAELTAVGDYATDTQRNIEGEIWQTYSTDLGGIHGVSNSYTGAFKFGDTAVTKACSWTSYDDAKSIGFDASLSVGAEHTGDEVKPKTMYGLYVVKAYSTVTSTSDINIQTLLQKAGEGFAIGDVKFSFTKTVPNGWLKCDGNLYNRSEYPDLYAWANDNNYLVSEETWQSLKTTNDNGSVGYFSTGNGTSTFRVFNIVDFLRAEQDESNYGVYQTDTVAGSGADSPGEDAFVAIEADDTNPETQPRHIKVGCIIKAKDVAVNRTLISDVEIKEAVDKIDELQGFILDADSDYTIGNTTVANNASESVASISNFQILRTLSDPNHFFYHTQPYISSANKNIVIIPAGLEINIGDYAFVTQSDYKIDLGLAGTAAERTGKDIYLYAMWPSEPASNIAPVFTASMNSTIPSGYIASNSRKIGGIHCLCADVGTIDGHKLSGYVAGDAIPNSLWDLNHRPVSNPEGMAYVEPIDLWVDIYLNSWNGTEVVSEYGAVIADGVSSRSYHWWRWTEEFNKLNKRLPHRWEFREFADGSPEAVNISGSNDPNTTGGHTATNGVRIISNYGLEDCTGVLWQWGDDLTTHGTTSGWAGYSYISSISPTETNRGGEYYATTYAARFGGYWDYGAYCGSRSVTWAHSVVALHDSNAGRGVARGL